MLGAAKAVSLTLLESWSSSSGLVDPTGVASTYCNTGFGCPTYLCDWQTAVWACGSVLACATDNYTMTDGISIVLIPAQVVALVPSSQALTIAPFATLSVADGVGGMNATTVTVMETATAPAMTTTPPHQTSSDASFTAGQMAGASVGLGIPLLLALLAACMVIYRQRRRLNVLAQVPAVGQQQVPQTRAMSQTYRAPKQPEELTGNKLSELEPTVAAHELEVNGPVGRARVNRQ